MGFTQTCCSGGAPLTGVLNLRAVKPGGWGVSMTYDDNKIEDIMLENELTNEKYLRRYTRTMLTQIDYGFTKNFTGTIVIPYVMLGQTTDSYNGPVEANTSGLGDLLLLGQYGKILPNQASIVLGGGIKLPVGETQGRSELGLILPANLQPGTGSFDFLLSLQYQTSFKFRRSLTFSQTFNARLNTVSTIFIFHNTYKFGNVFQAFSSFADQIVIAKILHTPSLTFRYRYQGFDILEGFANSNTGGHWITIAPGWATNVSKNMILGFTGEWPLYRDVNGFQLTTSRRLVVTLQFMFPKKEIDGFIDE